MNEQKELHLYVDGCRLNKGRHNPIETIGWAVIAVRKDQDGEKILGRISNNKRFDTEDANAEIFAILEATRYAKNFYQNTPEYTVVIHTDSPKMLSYKKHQKPYSGMLAEIKDVLDQSWIKLHKTAGQRGEPSKPANYMQMAHNMANDAAHNLRQTLQGNLRHPNGQIRPHSVQQNTTDNTKERE